MAASSGQRMYVLAHSDDPEMLNRFCVDCGLRTGCYCDYCLAKDRSPNEVWASGQHTPLCSHCDKEHDMLLGFQGVSTLGRMFPACFYLILIRSTESIR